MNSESREYFCTSCSNKVTYVKRPGVPSRLEDINQTKFKCGDWVSLKGERHEGSGCTKPASAVYIRTGSNPMDTPVFRPIDIRNVAR